MGLYTPEERFDRDMGYGTQVSNVGRNILLETPRSRHVVLPALIYDMRYVNLCSEETGCAGLGSSCGLTFRPFITHASKRIEYIKVQLMRRLDSLKQPQVCLYMLLTC